MKSGLYFKHDGDAMRDSKLSKLLLFKNGPTLYGLYWLIIEFLFELENCLGTFDQLKMRARTLGVPESTLRKIVTDFGLFVVEDETFYSKGLIIRVKEIEEKRAERLKKEAPKTCSHKLNEIDIPLDNNNIPPSNEDRREEKRKEEKSLPEKSREEQSLPEQSLPEFSKEIYTSTTTSTSKPSSSPEPEKPERPAGEIIDFSNFKFPMDNQPLRPVVDWEVCVEEAFSNQGWYEQVGMKSHLGEEFRDNPLIVKRLFKEHVMTQGNESAIRDLRQAKNYFANMMQPGSKTCEYLGERLHKLVKMENRNPFEDVDRASGERSYFGYSIPRDAPPRPTCNAVWNVKLNIWIS